MTMGPESVIQTGSAGFVMPNFNIPEYQEEIHRNVHHLPKHLED